MAAMIISRRAHPASTLLHALRLSAAASSSRSFAADAGQETSVDVGRRPAPAPQRRRSAAVPAPPRARARARAGGLLPAFFSDPWDPFNPGRALSQMLSLADQFLDVPFTRGGGGGLRRGWDAREDETALYVKVEMPGLGKEDVKVWVEGNTLVIQGEEEEEEDNDDDEGGGEGGEGATGEAAAEGKGKTPQRRRRFGGRVELPAKGYKLDEIRAEMKDGLLRVVVPKATADDDRADVKEVPVH